MKYIETAYNRCCKIHFPLPSEKQVADLEKRLGISFPPDYREYLLHFNGGFFMEPRISPPVTGCPLDRLTVMGGIGATHPTAELAPLGGGGFSPALFDDNDPPQVLPIGYTMMGNLLFVGTHPSDEYRGRIGMKIAYSDQAFFLSDGIEDFFSLLREPTDE